MRTVVVLGQEGLIGRRSSDGSKGHEVPLAGTEGATEQRANRSTVLNMISTGASMAGTLPKTCQSCGMWPVGSPTGTRYGGEGEVLTL